MASPYVLPFGIEQTATYQEEINPGDAHIDKLRFAGHSRDYHGMLNVENTSYLGCMHARYYEPNWGRFLSVDPVLQVKRAMKNPQMWNRYSYAVDKPVKYVDPTGARPLETGAPSQTHQYWIDEYQRQNLRNLVDDLRLDNIDVANVTSDAFHDAITVRIFSSGFDSTLDEQGHLAGGSRTERSVGGLTPSLFAQSRTRLWS